MNPHILLLLLTLTLLLPPFLLTHSTYDNFIYVGCTLLKFPPSSPYHNSLDSLLTSFLNSAAAPSLFSPFNTFISSPSPLISSYAAYGLYQCRGDLTRTACSRCVTLAVARLGDICGGSCGGALQLDGCFVKYDNESFFGADERRVVYERCEMGVENEGGVDGVLEILKRGGGDDRFRNSGYGLVKGMAQCVGDLSMEECQGCVGFAVDRLRDRCSGVAEGGDVFLEKCYARYWVEENSGVEGRVYYVGLALVGLVFRFVCM